MSDNDDDNYEPVIIRIKRRRADEPVEGLVVEQEVTSRKRTRVHAEGQRRRWKATTGKAAARRQGRGVGSHHHGGDNDSDGVDGIGGQADEEEAEEEDGRGSDDNNDRKANDENDDDSSMPLKAALHVFRRLGSVPISHALEQGSALLSLVDEQLMQRERAAGRYPQLKNTAEDRAALLRSAFRNKNKVERLKMITRRRETNSGSNGLVSQNSAYHVVDLAEDTFLEKVEPKVHCNNQQLHREFVTAAGDETTSLPHQKYFPESLEPTSNPSKPMFKPRTKPRYLREAAAPAQSESQVATPSSQSQSLGSSSSSLSLPSSQPPSVTSPTPLHQQQSQVQSQSRSLAPSSTPSFSSGSRGGSGLVALESSSPATNSANNIAKAKAALWAEEEDNPPQQKSMGVVPLARPPRKATRHGITFSSTPGAKSPTATPEAPSPTQGRGGKEGRSSLGATLRNDGRHSNRTDRNSNTHNANTNYTSNSAENGEGNGDGDDDGDEEMYDILIRDRATEADKDFVKQLAKESAVYELSPFVNDAFDENVDDRPDSDDMDRADHPNHDYPDENDLIAESDEEEENDQDHHERRWKNGLSIFDDPDACSGSEAGEVSGNSHDVDERMGDGSESGDEMDDRGYLRRGSGGRPTQRWSGYRDQADSELDDDSEGDFAFDDDNGDDDDDDDDDDDEGSDFDLADERAHLGFGNTRYLRNKYTGAIDGMYHYSDYVVDGIEGGQEDEAPMVGDGGADLAAGLRTRLDLGQ